MRDIRLSFILICVCAATVGCSDNGLAPPVGHGGDGGGNGGDGGTARPDGSSGSTDAGPLPDDGFVAAPHPPLPQIPFNGGKVIGQPEVITVTWKGDPLESQLQAFDSWLLRSAYFSQALAEYNIKSGMQEGVYSIPMPAPMTLDDTEIQAQLKSLIQNMQIPGVNASRIYSVYVPDGTVVTNKFGGIKAYTACVDLLAYHGVGPTVSGGAIIYTVTPRCHSMGISDLDYATWSSSAEIAKAATDPTYTGWYLKSQPGAPFGGDVASLCNNFGGPIEGHFVSAIYSNAAAKADQRPCVPAPVGPMFGAPPTPETLQMKPGASASTKVTVYSTGPLTKPLSLSVYGYPMNDVTVKASAAFAQNGDQVTIDISLSNNAKSGSMPVALLQLDSGDYHWENYVVVYVQ